MEQTETICTGLDTGLAEIFRGGTVMFIHFVNLKFSPLFPKHSNFFFQRKFFKKWPLLCHTIADTYFFHPFPSNSSVENRYNSPIQVNWKRQKKDDAIKAKNSSGKSMFCPPEKKKFFSEWRKQRKQIIIRADIKPFRCKAANTTETKSDEVAKKKELRNCKFHFENNIKWERWRERRKSSPTKNATSSVRMTP